MNIVDYVKNNIKTFAEEPFNVVDSLVFSWLSYIQWDDAQSMVGTWFGLPLQQALQAEYFTGMFAGTYDPVLTQEMFMYMAASPRYRNCVLKGYVNDFDEDLQKQFSALTIEWKDDTHFISFRGTDSTFVGWKEDFNMAFSYPVPAQKDASDYLTMVSQMTTGELYVGGHSKGGNLAIAAAAENPDLFDRIKHVYSHDGPGFMDKVIRMPSFQNILTKTTKVVPQSSFIGMIMQNDDNYKVVKSDSISFWQHNPFTWQIDGNDMVWLDALPESSKKGYDKFNNWLSTKTVAERERFIDSVYSVIGNVDATTIAELNDNWRVNYPKIMDTFAQLDGDTKKFIFEIIGDYFTYRNPGK